MAEILRTPTGQVSRLEVEFGTSDAVDSYPAFVGSNPTRPFARYLAALPGVETAVIIADANTAEILGPTYEAAFISAGIRTVALTVPAGESAKSWDVAGALLEALAAEVVGQHDVLVGLGGGAVCDLAGFVAATYRRGVRFAPIPTSLLAMVDASLGGKSALNLHAGKNMVGARRAPSAVLLDIDALVTLPDVEYRNGLAEVVKMAVVDGESSVEWLEGNLDRLLERDDDALIEVIGRSIDLQGRVERAEFGSVSDKALSLGHTLGYALERLAGFGELAHGIAVADGLRFALLASASYYGTDTDLYDRVTALLHRCGLPAGDYTHTTLNIGNAMRSDKKVVAGDSNLILVREAGVLEVVPFSEDELFELVRVWAGRERYRDYEFEARIAAREAAEAESALAELDAVEE